MWFLAMRLRLGDYNNSRRTASVSSNTYILTRESIAYNIYYILVRKAIPLQYSKLFKY